MLFHSIGLDGLGHHAFLESEDIEKGVLHVESVVRKVFDNFVDDDTILLCVGDHGMRSDGEHGGDSPGEMRTVFFAYSKEPFAMAKFYRENLEEFEEINSRFKQ